MKTLEWPWQTPECGIYFDMSFEEYLAIPCLQSSSIKTLDVGGSDFWENSWMCDLPDKEVDDDSKAKLDGRAYHKYILEGEEAFYKEYAPDWEPEDGVEYLRTNEEIKGELVKHGAATSGTKAVLTERLLDANPNARLYDHEQAMHRAKYEGKELVDGPTMRRILYAAKIIDIHPHYRTWLAGGYPEVSVIWDDPVWGVRCKCRFDYMKVGPIVDLKTFANRMRKKMERAVYTAMTDNKYPISGAFYLRGAMFARDHIKAGRVHDFKGPQAWLDECAKTPCNQMNFLFQKKSLVPQTQGLIFRTESKEYKISMRIIEEACQRFNTYYETFGESLWGSLEPPIESNIDDYAAYTWGGY